MTKKKQKIEEAKKSEDLDPEKIGTAVEELVAVLQKHKLNVGELTIGLGNLCYLVGASVDGYKGKGPGTEELQKLYYSNPTIGIALMIQGMTMTTWYEDWAKQR